MTRVHQSLFALGWVALAAAATPLLRTTPVRAQGQVREFTVTADQFAYAPPHIEIRNGDLVKITFTAKDIAHSFTIDSPYRIAKRAGAGQTIVIEFRADQSGDFPIYCNLSQDERCRNMKGHLTVK
jgi:heme/copper-type cytochrome/quinol oxidase subunit 2